MRPRRRTFSYGLLLGCLSFTVLPLCGFPVQRLSPVSGAEPQADGKARGEAALPRGARAEKGATAKSQDRRKDRGDAARRASREIRPDPASRDGKVKEGSSRERTVKDRWSSLPPTQRREIQALYEKLRTLTPGQRSALLAKLRALDAAERRRILQRAQARMQQGPIERKAADLRRDLLRARIGKLSPAERERLATLSPEERTRYLAEEAREERERLLSSLPADARKEALSLPPQEQARFLRAYRSAQVFRETFRDPEEVRRLRALSPRELTGLLRPQRTEAAPPERPSILSEATWGRWRRLKAYEQTRVLALLAGDGSRPPPPQRPSAAHKQQVPQK